MFVIKLAIASTAIILLASCSGFPISTPFQLVQNKPVANTNQPQTTQQLLMVVTEAIVKNESSLESEFQQRVDDIYANLEAQPGLYGYSIRKQLLGDTAWTMTIWYDEASLVRFKSTAPHSQAMTRSPEILTGASFYREWISEADAPPDWDKIIKKVKKSKRSYQYEPSIPSAE